MLTRMAMCGCQAFKLPPSSSLWWPCLLLYSSSCARGANCSRSMSAKSECWLQQPTIALWCRKTALGPSKSSRLSMLVAEAMPRHLSRTRVQVQVFGGARLPADCKSELELLDSTMHFPLLSRADEYVNFKGV